MQVTCTKCRQIFPFTRHLELFDKPADHGTAGQAVREANITCNTKDSPDFKKQQIGATASPAASPAEILRVPLWVKAIVVFGAILFAVQVPGFPSSLNDAIIKNRAAIADRAGQYTDAIMLYEELRTRYPKDKELIKKLAFCQYHAGQYVPALKTFELLDGVEMPKNEIEKINAAISDIKAKIK